MTSSHPLISTTSLCLFFSLFCLSTLCTHTHTQTQTSKKNTNAYRLCDILHVHISHIFVDIGTWRLYWNIYLFFISAAWEGNKRNTNDYILYIGTSLQPRQVWGQSSTWGPTLWQQSLLMGVAPMPLFKNHWLEAHCPPVVCKRKTSLSVTYPSAGVKRVGHKASEGMLPDWCPKGKMGMCHYHVEFIYCRFCI